MKVLVAIDTVSATSYRTTMATICGRTWPCETNFYLFSVLENDVGSLTTSADPSSKRALLEQRIHVLYEAMLELETIKPAAAFICQVATGEVVSTIVATARELNVDLIVIGMPRSTSGAKQNLEARLSDGAHCRVDIAVDAVSHAA